MKTYPCQGVQGVQTASVGKPYTIPDGLSGAYKQLSEQLSEPQPFTLTWDGKHYIPNFIPTDIRVVAYTQAQYVALNEAYQSLKVKTAMYAGLEREAMRLKEFNLSLCDLIYYLTEKTLALQHLWSAKHYLRKVDPENYHNQFILGDAIQSLHVEEFDFKGAKEKYFKIDETGHLKHVEERSI